MTAVRVMMCGKTWNLYSVEMSRTPQHRNFAKKVTRQLAENPDKVCNCNAPISGLPGQNFLTKTVLIPSPSVSFSTSVPSFSVKAETSLSSLISSFLFAA